MRSKISYSLLIFSIVIAICSSGCKQATDSTNDPGNDNGSSRSIALTKITDYPSIGGNVTGVAFTADNKVLAVINKKLYKMNSNGSDLQVINEDPIHFSIALAPSGELYALTLSDNYVTTIRTYDLSMGQFKSYTANVTRAEYGTIKISPQGEPYVHITDNWPNVHVFRSKDKGDTWKEMVFYSGAHTLASGGEVDWTSTAMFAADAAGFYKSTDDGVTWTRPSTNMPNFWGVRLLMASNGYVFAYVKGAGYLKLSKDGGNTFADAPSPAFIQMAEGADGTLYAITKNERGLMKSTDHGTTWKLMIYVTGNTFTVQGNKMAIGLDGGFNGNDGGLYLSSNLGTTWISTGLGSTETVSDIAVDKDGNLLMLAKNTLFRKTTSGWNVLGSAGLFGRLATAPPSNIALFSVSSVIFSSDNGVTWTENLVPDYLYGGVGRIELPALTGRKNGEFLFSITTYRDDIYPPAHTNGRLYHVRTTGKVEESASSRGRNFVKVLEDANGVLYGSTVNFDDLLISHTQAFDWDPFPQDVFFPVAFNSQNKYLTYRDGLRFGSWPSTTNLDQITFQGLDVKNTTIDQFIFDSQDRLYLKTYDGIYYTNDPLK